MKELIADWPGKRDGAGNEHAAVYHMLDVAAVGEILLSRIDMPAPQRDALVFLIALHDLGKIGAPFRAMLRDGVRQDLRHWEYTEVLLHKHDAQIENFIGGKQQRREHLYAATAGHHGRPPTADLSNPRLWRALGAEAQRDSAEVIATFAQLWPGASLDDLTREDALRLSWWLPGCVAAADWIGSNEEWFPFVAAGPGLGEYLDHARTAARNAVEASGLWAPAPSEAPLYDFDPRPMQHAVMDIPLSEGPMLVVIEDETGAGKTEAAFLLAQKMMLAGKGRGIYFALPTMATANAMFLRAHDTVGRLFLEPPSLTLAHGRARLLELFRDLRLGTASDTDEPVCTEWLTGNRRRALMATVGVGTIDQALLSVLPTKYSTLRHYGLASKILIVDEVHEMGEPYLACEVARLLRAHRMSGGSAILLTATLPLEQRAELLAAFDATDDGDPAYPALTVAGGAARRDFPAARSARGLIAVERLGDAEAAVEMLVARSGDGAACLWVRNAVDDAIDSVRALRARGVDADLLHARFALKDRLVLEGAALSRFGKAGAGRAGRVLVATQVVELSLDLDFDVMVSDLAPVAALIQRAGRLWRHMAERPAGQRPVPAPVLHVVSPDPDDVPDERWLMRVLDRGAWVYPSDIQWRTAQVLFGAGVIDAPAGLRSLIEAVHGPSDLVLPAPLVRAEEDRIGRGYAASNLAGQNLITLMDGFREGAKGADDREFPTRLGLPTRTLLLTVNEGGVLLPYGGPGADGLQLSEVRVAENRLHDLELPDQTRADIAAMTADWRDWQRAAVTVCPLGEGGRICEELRYDAGEGLVFDT